MDASPLAITDLVGEVHRRHRNGEFPKFSRTIDGSMPQELDIDPATDNHGTHKALAVKAFPDELTTRYARYTTPVN
jgi:hypothetical protein